MAGARLPWPPANIRHWSIKTSNVPELHLESGATVISISSAEHQGKEPSYARESLNNAFANFPNIFSASVLEN